MRKILFVIITVILILIALMYWSLWSTTEEFKRCEILDHDHIASIDFRKHDSVLVAASTLYEANELKLLMQGQQYRKAWATPVNVPILFLDTLYGGAEILEEGGGKQTHSLKLKVKNGTIYTLRSINKNPEPLIPEFAKTLGLENIIIDGISAQHPYAAILVAELSKKANILNTNPKAVFVPKQKGLQNYNEKYGNRLFLLEYETEGEVNWTGLNNIKKLIDTEDLQELKVTLKDSLQIDKRALVRARLFDFLIGDWDRHTKQWGWAIQKRNNGLFAIPIPGDRDNAFFNTDGLIPSILSNKNIVPKLRPFEADIDFIEGLVYPFDRYFLLNTDVELYKEEAKALQDLLSDNAIDDALKVWSKEITALNGKEITEKIKSRRAELIEYAILFNKEIDKQGVINEPLKGSEDLDLNDGLSKCFDCN